MAKAIHVSPIAPQSTSGAQAIACYLNESLALLPPLKVAGQPPHLKIYLSQSHILRIGALLPQLEQAVQSLSGPKYWELYIYSGDPAIVAVPPLIHHRLLVLERLPVPITSASRHSLSVSLLNQRTPVTTSSQSAFSLSSGAAKEGDRRPSAKGQLQLRLARHRRQRQRRRIWMGIAALSLLSFGAGLWVAAGFRELALRSRSIPAASNAESKAESAIASSLEGAMPSQKVPENSVPQSAPESPLMPPWRPITQHNGLGAATHILATPIRPEAAVTLKAVGDIIPGTNFPDYRLPENPNYLFDSVRMFMGEVDLLFGNFESTLTDYPYSAKDISRGMTFAFRTPPHFATTLQAAGFDILSVANNHSFDFGTLGFEDTIAHIEQTGMKAVGRKDQIVVVEANGYAIAFIGFSYWSDHNDMNNLAAAAALIQTAQAQADMVVVSVHAGAEGTDALRVQNRTEYFFSENRGNMVQFSRAMIDAGADLILGHGPHVPRAVELYRNKLIAYSLGNFVGYRTLSTVGPLGQSMILHVEMNEAGDFLQGRIIPVALDPNGVPYIDNFFETVTLVRQLTIQDFATTPLEIDQMGYILKTDL